MRTLTMVSKNISRRKGRAIISSIGLILAVAVIVATFTISGSMQTQIANELEKYGASIVVTPSSQSISIPYGSVVVGNNLMPQDTVEKIYQIPNNQNIRVISPKLYNQVQLGNNTIVVVGLLADKEIQLKNWWKISGSLPQNSSYEILVGSEVATVLNLQVASSITISNSSFAVTGVLERTGSVDDYSIFMPLDISQKLFNREGQISEINVSLLHNDGSVERVSGQIMAAFPDVKASPIKQAAGTRTLAVQQTASFSLLLASIILVVGIAGITNTMQASVNQRMGEIGVLLSLGADDVHLYKMLLSESILLGLIAGVVGTAVGILTSMLMGITLINTPISPAEVPLFVIPFGIGLSVVASVMASLYPTWRASKIDPVTALKGV